jgi:hypothetical protein
MKGLRTKTLVLGASIIPSRYSNIAIKRLLEHKFEVEAIGNKKGIVSGVQIHTSQKDFKDIDTVTIYLNAKNQEAYYNYIINLNPRRVIFNPGAENDAFQQMLTNHNIASETSCTLVLLSVGQY